MKKFFLKIFLLVLLVIFTSASFFLLPSTYDNNLAGLLNKIRVLKRIESPRIIFVGGSGIYLGLDSSVIEQKIGRNVFNMGLYGGFGILNLLEILEPYVRSGDLVVVIPEYDNLFNEFGVYSSGNENISIPNAFAKKWLFAADPVLSLRNLYLNSLNNSRDFLPDFVSLLQIKFKSIFQNDHKFINGYSAYQDDEHGDSKDFPPKLSLNNFDRKKIEYGNRILDPEYIKRLNDFYNIISKRGADSVFIFPAYPYVEYELNQKNIEGLYQQIIAKVKMQVLGTPEVFLYPYGYFADTINHLTSSGRKLRTINVVKLLAKYLNVKLNDDISADLLSISYEQEKDGVLHEGLSPSVAICASGFQSDNVWTEGDASISCFKEKIRKKDKYFVIETKGWNTVFDDVDKMDLKVYLNEDSVMLKFAYKDKNDYYFILPKGISQIDQVEISSKVFVPKDVGLGDDVRTLGLDISSVRIK
jgi:hypothetical protein